jgi:hypothetical protein
MPNLARTLCSTIFLGFLEAGVSPIFMLVVGQFYKKDEQAFMMG